MKTVHLVFVIAGSIVGSILLNPGPAFGLTPDLNGNPYRAIADRNIFGLHDPPVSEPPPVDPEQNASNVKLAGITKILGKTQVLMLVQEMGPNGKPLPDSKEESYMLSVGQAQGPIEVVEVIDEDKGKVRIKNAGKPMVISFETHGTKLAAAPPSVAPAARIPAPPVSAPVGRRPGFRNIPEGVPVATPSGIQAFPPRPVRTNPDQSSFSAPQARSPVSGLTPDEEAAAAYQYVAIEVNRETTKPDVEAGLVPPLPMTPLTPAQPEGGNEGLLQQ